MAVESKKRKRTQVRTPVDQEGTVMTTALVVALVVCVFAGAASAYGIVRLVCND